MTRAAIGLLLAGSALSAQLPRDDSTPATYWWLPTAVGGFSFGAALGYSATAISQWRPWLSGETNGYPRRTFQQVSWTSAILGGLIGVQIGRSVDKALRQRRPVSTFKRRAVRFATVLAGAGVGAGVSYQVVTRKPEDYRWDPPRLVLVSAMGPGLGAVGGYLIQHWSRHPSAPPSERNSR